MHPRPAGRCLCPLCGGAGTLQVDVRQGEPLSRPRARRRTPAFKEIQWDCPLLSAR
ncbi:MAG: hypothetical protein HY924_00695 [Elusimicrobia bacterium]|nr:hypothetical protein [Elusimicrobiota bacterium]